MLAKTARHAGAVLFPLIFAAILGSSASDAAGPGPALSRAGFREASLFKGMSWTALGPKSAGGRIETSDCPPDSPGTIRAGMREESI